MQTYIAHYSSPAASDARAKGLFEFESESRAGSKANLHDAPTQYNQSHCSN